MARAKTPKRASAPASKPSTGRSRASAASRVSAAATSAISGMTATKAPDPKALARRGEMIGLIIIGLTVLFGAALLSFDPADMDAVEAGRGVSGDVQNLMGPVGARIADLLLQLVGIGAFALDALLLTIGVRTLLGKDLVPTVRTVAGGIGVTFGGLMLVHLVARAVTARPFGHEAAGFMGSAVAEFTRAFVSTAGTTLLGVILLVTSVSALSGRPLIRLAAAALSRHGHHLKNRAKQRLAGQWQATREEWRERRAAKAEAKSAEAEARQLEAEALAEAEEQRQAEAEEGLPVAWRPETGLYRVPNSGESASLPNTRPSKPSHLAAKPRGDGATQDTAGSDGFPFGRVVAPAADLIPTPVRTERARSEAPAGPPPAGPAPRVATRDEADFPVFEAQSADATEVTTAAEGRTRARPSYPSLVAAAPAPAPHAEDRLAAEANSTVDDAVLAAPSTSAPDAAKKKPGDVVEPSASQPRPAQPKASAGPKDPSATAATAATPAAAAPDPLATALRVPRIIKTPAISEPKPAADSSEQGALDIGDKKVWKRPPRYLVQSPPNRVVAAPQAVLVDNARVLEQKLEDFKIMGQVTDIRPGPVVTTYEYKPAPGMRISKIVSLKDDLTMSLSALRVRVVAPIPGRDVVGIEVPNKQRQFVYFREVLDSEQFNNSKSNLTIILGKDIEGSPVVSDLAKAPHMLVAGATGTGKSVGINSFLCSMLYKASPDDVKFIMIDPKVLELCIYDGIPHLLLPPVSEPHHAELALKWAVREMERRYRVLAGAKVRNISGYRAKLPELRENARKKKMKVVDGKKVLVDANSPGAELLDSPPTPETMPYIVVVIDEFADLIMASGKEVERSVARLAQKARACGIHVILATQRPSTDVLTGMIKANFPTRISFQVASSIDSKVVLGSIGAESLLGMGDLLYVPPGSSHLKRCHGTWITDDEVAAIADHWKAQGTPNYDMSILEDPESDGLVEDVDAKLDTLFEDAVQVALEAQQASVSFLQRKLGIGYGRAARIIDHMEAKGIVGPQRSANKPREILLSSGEAGL